MTSISNIISDIKSKNLTIDDLLKIAKEYNIPIKTKKERLADALSYMSKEYIPYPQKQDDNFFRKIYGKKEFYENRYQSQEHKEDDIQKKLCPSKDKKFQLLPHQVILRNYMNFNTPYNGVLVFHGLGSGKTCSSITIAESYRKTLTDTIKNKTLVLVSGDTIEENFRNEIHSINKGYNQCTFSDYINYNPYDKTNVKQSKVDNLIDKNYEIEHYQRLSNIIGSKKKELTNEEFKKWIEQTYSNRVFIIDEVHNLKLREKKGEVATSIKRYDAVMLILKHSKNMKLVLLSGTPMSHSAKEIVDILNLLLINDGYDPIKSVDIFDKQNNITREGAMTLRKLSKGYISYITKENPFTFPEKKYNKEATQISTFIEKKFGLDLFQNINITKEFKIIPCVMGKEQKKQYLSFLNKDSKKNSIQDLIQLQLIKYDHTEKDSVYKIKFDDFKESNIERLSTKFHKLLKNIKNSPGPIFIYSNYKDKGIFMIASMLLKNGIDILNSRKDDKTNPLFSKKFKSRRTRPSHKNQICAICTNKRDGEHDGHTFKPMKFDFIIGQTTDEVQKTIKETFNNPKNNKGEMLKIIIGSSVLKEGVSFFRVRQLHVLEPWHNKSRLDQVIGRGLRHCSHKDLKPEDRNIEIFLYCATLSNTFKYKKESEKKKIKKKMEEFFQNDNQTKVPIEYAKPAKKGEEPLLSYDAIMYKRAEILDYYIKQVDLILKQNAFDCALNRELNIKTLPKDEQYMCATFDEQDEFELSENDIDLSTYDNVFLTPYIKYTISLLKQFFENKTILYEKELKSHPKLQDSIYKQENHYILRKALDIIVPKTDDMRNFQHIIEHKRKYGYIFVRKMKTDNIYIYKNFDEQTRFFRSDFEVSPIYEQIYEREEEKQNSFKTFLNILERKEGKERGKQLYLKTLTQITSKPGQKKKIHGKVGNIALDEIKRLDPIKNHSKDGEFVGIVIDKKDFEGKMWIRKTALNRNKKGDNIKQYSYGQECITAYKRPDIINIIRKLWKRVDKKSPFYKNNLNKYDLTMKNIKPMKKKKATCPFLQEIMEHLSNQKTEGKIWFKKLR